MEVSSLVKIEYAILIVSTFMCVIALAFFEGEKANRILRWSSGIAILATGAITVSL